MAGFEDRNNVQQAASPEPGLVDKLKSTVHELADRYLMSDRLQQEKKLQELSETVNQALAGIKTPGDGPNYQVQNVIRAVRDIAAKKNGEKNPEVSKMMDAVLADPKKLPEVIRALADQGQLFNPGKDLYQGDVFIPAAKVTRAPQDYPAIVALHGKEGLPETETLYKVNDKSFRPVGINMMGVPVLNEIQATRVHQSMSQLVPNNEVWNKTSTANYIKAAEGNELIHGVLHDSLGVTGDTPVKISNVAKSGVAIKNSAEAQEFLSDVVSVNTDRTDIVRLVRDAVSNFKSYGENGPLVERTDNYGPSDNFVMGALADIYKKKGLDFSGPIERHQQYEDSVRTLMSTEPESSYESIQRQANEVRRGLVTELLSPLNENDIKQISERFMQAGKEVIGKLR